VLRWLFMQLSGIFLGLGEPTFTQLLRTVSIGKLKTYQIYGRMKVILRVPKLNSEHLRKWEPRFWERLNASEEDFATDLAQAILVSHLDMIKAVLDELGIPNQEGFFAKDIDGTKYLTEGWQQRVYDKFQSVYPLAVLLFYINHLDWELSKSEKIFQPSGS